MAKKIECRIAIAEVDGKLHIMANIPDHVENTIAGALARALIDHSAVVMNKIMGENQTVEKVVSN